MANTYKKVENLPSDGKNINGFELKSDMCQTLIPYDKCYIPKNFYDNQKFVGLSFKLLESGLKVKISGKVFATPTSLGLITSNNFKQLPEIVYKLSGVEVDEDYFLNIAALKRFDVTEDIIVKDEPRYYISELREVFKRVTDKFDVYKYKNTTYENGLSLVPKIQCYNRIISYSKYSELMKCKNKKYREQFDYEFLQQTKQILRFEYQMKHQETMRKELGISQDIKPTIANAFECRRNVIGDMLNNLITGGNF